MQIATTVMFKLGPIRYTQILYLPVYKTDPVKTIGNDIAKFVLQVREIEY